MAETRTLFAKHILRQIFLEDWALKLTALVITLGLWFGVTVVSRGKQASERFSAPLNFRVLDNAIVTSAPVQEVELRVRGSGDKVDQIRRSDLIVNVDLSEIQPGERVIELTPETVSVPLPEGVKLVDLQPSRVPVTIEAAVEKDVEVHAVTTGRPAAGFEVYGDPLIVPKKVKIRGPRSVVDPIDHLFTDKISLDGRDQDLIARQIPITSPDNRITIYNTVVDVSFKIGEKRVEHTFTVPASEAVPKAVSVTLYGPKSILAKLRTSEIKVEPVRGDQDREVMHVVLPADLVDIIEVKRPAQQ
ncbi:MAG: hypothetical protein HS105_13145 [Chloracidobacterium sp.]|nr:hypothetical protein [Chloracidobacterium sp.]MCC6825048.1 hypothetical protein [Acidobacteriota bacterium]MCO5334149.1 CdaR family protein [Pyrinomonadaceae bacterium]